MIGCVAFQSTQDNQHFVATSARLLISANIYNLKLGSRMLGGAGSFQMIILGKHLAITSEYSINLLHESTGLWVTQLVAYSLLIATALTS